MLKTTLKTRAKRSTPVIRIYGALVHFNATVPIWITLTIAACGLVAFAAFIAWSAHGQSALHFTDVTPGSGLDLFSHNPNAPSVPGSNEWIMGGIGVADFNGDRLVDIFVHRGRGAKHRARPLHPQRVRRPRAAWGDLHFDRDGDLDLLMLVNSGPLRLDRNDSTKMGAVAGA